jgi:hypothetical protein
MSMACSGLGHSHESSWQKTPLDQKRPVTIQHIRSTEFCTNDENAEMPRWARASLFAPETVSRGAQRRKTGGVPGLSIPLLPL